MGYPDTIDWVEQTTGDRRAVDCALAGCDKVVVGPVQQVNGHPAALHECPRCGKRGFHWIPKEGTS